MKPDIRLALHYVLLFGATGVSLPFAGLWLTSRGLTGAEIGVLLAAPMLGRLVTGPMIAVWADGFRLRRTPMAWLGLAAALGYGLAGLCDQSLIRAAAWFVAASAAAALIPLTDVLNLRVARRTGHAFAFPRGCGSAAFVCANVAVGALLTAAPVDLVIAWITAAGAAIGLYAWRVLPAEPVSATGPVDGMARFRGLGRLVRDPIFVIALLAIGAVQAAHAFYYAFSAILWKAQGIDERTTGLLWAFSVIIEIGFMWWVEPWRRRLGIGPWAVLMAGVVAAVVRWGVMALAPPLWALWPLQTLHALTFAATYLAGVQIIDRLTPDDSHTAAQTLNSMLAAGVLIGLATLASGPLYDQGGALGYLAMAAMALVGGGLAWAVRRRLAEPV
ncbi:MAG: MFS transporter [Brevundimonas sp.]|uniref:MFS transporter n=1 Tax=Brevundimonas sp. TaxID=1871086 RepID=UPI0025B9FAD4|nr:MFS transporter [Brevundimonas sp.]MBX3478044.1 MFS transporter [Brevundimonas sp.]